LKQAHFTCQALAAAISTLVTNALLEGDSRRDLPEPLIRVPGS
jgi:hypothetical protein